MEHPSGAKGPSSRLLSLDAGSITYERLSLLLTGISVVFRAAFSLCWWESSSLHERVKVKLEGRFTYSYNKGFFFSVPRETVTISRWIYAPYRSRTHLARSGADGASPCPKRAGETLRTKQHLNVIMS